MSNPSRPLPSDPQSSQGLPTIYDYSISPPPHRIQTTDTSRGSAVCPQQKGTGIYPSSCAHEHYSKSGEILTSPPSISMQKESSATKKDNKGKKQSGRENVRPPILHASLQFKLSQATESFDGSEASAYLNMVKAYFVNRPYIYDMFWELLREHASRKISLKTVVQRTAVLFHDTPSLFPHFNKFLPPGYHITTTELNPPYKLNVTTPDVTLPLFGNFHPTTMSNRDSLAQEVNQAPKKRRNNRRKA